MNKNFKIYVYETFKKYLKNKNNPQLQNEVGKILLKLAELATIRYNFNNKSHSCGVRYIDIENIKGEIVYNLWKMISYDKKLNLKRLKNEKSMYNFLMMSANNFAKYYIRKELTNEGKLKITSYEQACESFNNENERDVFAIDIFKEKEKIVILY